MTDSEKEKIKESGVNPWAVCRAMQKKHGWGDAKFEQCVLGMKKEMGVPGLETYAEFMDRMKKMSMLSEYMEDELGLEADIFAEGGVRSGAWGSPGGKRWLAPVIVPLIPVHETYVEVFAGGAAVFFYRPTPSKREVLNDKNPDIAAGYAFLKTATGKDAKEILSMPWDNNKEYFMKVKALDPARLSPAKRFYRFFYLKRFSWGNTGLRFGFKPDKTIENCKSWLERKLPQYVERLRNVIVENMDFVDVIKKYDSPSTFFYMDPPYERDLDPSLILEETGFDHKKFAQMASSTKGKVMVSYDDTPGNRERLSKLEIKFVRTPIQSGSFEHRTSGKKRTEILAANFPIDPKNKFSELLMWYSDEDGQPDVINGLVLKAPYGKMIADGKKKAIVKTSQMDISGRTMLLIEGAMALGEIVLSQPETITPIEFERRKSEHQVSVNFDDTNKKLYCYKVEEWKPFQEPRRIQRSKDPQVLILEVKFA